MSIENGFEPIGNDLGSAFIDAVVEGNRSKIIERFRTVRIQYENNESGVEGLMHVPKGMELLNAVK